MQRVILFAENIKLKKNKQINKSRKKVILMGEELSLINLQREYYYKAKMKLIEELVIYPNHRVSKILTEICGTDRLSDCNIFGIALAINVLGANHKLKEAA